MSIESITTGNAINYRSNSSPFEFRIAWRPLQRSDLHRQSQSVLILEQILIKLLWFEIVQWHWPNKRDSIVCRSRLGWANQKKISGEFYRLKRFGTTQSEVSFWIFGEVWWSMSIAHQALSEWGVWKPKLWSEIIELADAEYVSPTKGALGLELPRAIHQSNEQQSLFEKINQENWSWNLLFRWHSKLSLSGGHSAVSITYGYFRSVSDSVWKDTTESHRKSCFYLVVI